MGSGEIVEELGTPSRGDTGALSVAHDVGVNTHALSERLGIESLQEKLHTTAIGLWRKGIGNMGSYSDRSLPITNCLGSAQILGEQLQISGYTPQYCYMYLEKGDTLEPADHVVPIVAIDGRVYTIDSHLKNTTLFALPDVGGDPVEVVFNADTVEGSGSGSHVTIYTRLDQNNVRVERKQTVRGTVFQSRILELTPRINLDDLGNFFASGRQVIKYEQYIRAIDGSEFNFMFRADPKNDTSGEYVSKIIIGTTTYVEDQFELVQAELVRRMGKEDGERLLDVLMQTRDTFIVQRQDQLFPTEEQIQQFSLNN